MHRCMNVCCTYTYSVCISTLQILYGHCHTSTLYKNLSQVIAFCGSPYALERGQISLRLKAKSVAASAAAASIPYNSSINE